MPPSAATKRSAGGFTKIQRLESYEEYNLTRKKTGNSLALVCLGYRFASALRSGPDAYQLYLSRLARKENPKISHVYSFGRGTEGGPGQPRS